MPLRDPATGQAVNSADFAPTIASTFFDDQNGVCPPYFDNPASTTFITDGADMDSVAAGELFRLKVTRDATSDDASGDAELYAVEIRES